MTRSREKVIVVFSIFSLIACAVTLWKISTFSPLQRYSNGSQQNRQGAASGEQIIAETLPRQHLARKDLKSQPSPLLKYDTWSTEGAMDHLKRYNKFLNGDKKPITVDPGNFSTITEWWQAVAMFAWYIRSPVRYKCRSLVWFGGWAVCQDAPYTVTAPCLVYSFGIAYDFTFDDQIGHRGCDVRSFDPSMLNISDHRRSANVQFYRYGLGDQNTDSFRPDLDSYVKNQTTWKMRTLKHIVRELGHEGMTIDVLKIDIESTEWHVLDNLMETDMLRYVRHLLIEYHFFPTRPPKINFVHYFQVLTKLRQMGFREYYNRPHSEFVIPDAYRHQGETFYINVNFRPNNQPQE